MTTTYTNNGTQTLPVPNDPLGFDLGNGLFYDLNQNLSLRIDKMLDFSDAEYFSLKKFENPLDNKGLKMFTFENDTLFKSNSETGRFRYLYHRAGPSDSISFMNGDILKYVIVHRDSSLVCRNKRKVKKEIITMGDGKFVLDRGNRDFDFVQNSNAVDLQSGYLIEISDANKLITIYRLNNSGRKTVLYSMVRSRDALYIFDKNYRGNKIVFEGRSLSIFRNKNLVEKFQLNSQVRTNILDVVP